MVAEKNKKGDSDEHRKFVVDSGQEPVRIDKYLFARIANSTRTRIQYAAQAGNIFVNGKVVKPGYKIKPGDEISIVFAHPPRPTDVLPENIPLDIIYEDADLLVLNKKAGMVVHPAHGNYSGTLVNALLHYLDAPSPKGEKKNIALESALRPGLVHRLDKNTSGLMVVAKNELAMARLAMEMHERTILRKYAALVWGEPLKKEGTVNINIGRNPGDRKKMASFPDGNRGKHAVTHYRVVEGFGCVSLMECKLETGRTHQIRVHMKHIGHPVFNDAEYGGNKMIRGASSQKYRQLVQQCFMICPRQALHAKELSFIHPVSKKLLRFETNMPEDMQGAIEMWRKYS